MNPRAERALQRISPSEPNRQIYTLIAQAELFADAQNLLRMSQRAGSRTHNQLATIPAGSMFVMAHRSGVGREIAQRQIKELNPHWKTIQVVCLPTASQFNELAHAWDNHVQLLGGQILRDCPHAAIVFAHEWVEKRWLDKVEGLANSMSQLTSFSDQCNDSLRRRLKGHGA